MTRTKVIHIVSDIDKALAFEWMAFHLKSSCDLSFVLIGLENTALQKYLNSIAVPVTIISDQEHSSHLRKWFQIVVILLRTRPDVVHTHLWRATLLGISASWVLGIRKRIFTRHHATLHYQQFPSGRKWDRLCNFMATNIVAISESIRIILVEWDKAQAIKVRIIHHGFELDEFESVDHDRVKPIRSKYKLENHPVIGVISRYTSWKGIQFVIPAFAKIREQYPDAVLVLANARGDYKTNIERLLEQIPKDNYREIEFENDLPALFKTFDVFVHVPIDPFVEAFGQTYIEALASGVPSIFTLSGVAPEFIINEHNALVVPFQNSQAIYDAMMKLTIDSQLRNKLTSNGKLSIVSFSIDKMVNSLTALYEE